MPELPPNTALKPVSPTTPRTTGTAQNAGTTGTARANAPRVAAASPVGATIEYYDFTVYGTASALVLGPAFFPSGNAAFLPELFPARMRYTGASAAFILVNAFGGGFAPSIAPSSPLARAMPVPPGHGYSRL
jgi:hypothetical protein